MDTCTLRRQRRSGGGKRGPSTSALSAPLLRFPCYAQKHRLRQTSKPTPVQPWSAPSEVRRQERRDAGTHQHLQWLPAAFCHGRVTSMVPKSVPAAQPQNRCGPTPASCQQPASWARILPGNPLLKATSSLCPSSPRREWLPATVNLWVASPTPAAFFALF